jgi:hypothetical protein
MRPLRPYSLALLLLLLGCGGAGTININPASYTLSVSPQITSLAVNSTQTFAASTNAPTQDLDWVIVNSTYSNVGTLSGSGTSETYTAPSTPPIYSNNGEQAGTVTLRTLVGATEVQQTFTITAPSITVGFTTSPATVALGATLTVNAYAVGSTNSAITLQVNGVTGGSVSTGTIAAIAGEYGEYTYTAPATMPITGSTIKLTVVSTADPTKTANLILTLQ